MRQIWEKAMKHRAAPWIIWPLWVAVCFIGSILVVMAAVQVLHMFSMAEFLQTTGGELGLEAVIYVVMLLLVLSIPYGKKLIDKTVMGVQRAMTMRDIGLGIAGYVIYFIIFLVLTLALKSFLPGYDANQTQDLGFSVLLGWERIFAFALFVIVAPFAEEAIMRGFLFGKLRQSKMPFWPAAIVVSLLFAVAHGQWNVGVDTFILSMVACWLREVTKTIWPGVVIHMIKNFVAFMVLFVWIIR